MTMKMRKRMSIAQKYVQRKMRTRQSVQKAALMMTSMCSHRAWTRAPTATGRIREGLTRIWTDGTSYFWHLTQSNSCLTQQLQNSFVSLCVCVCAFSNLKPPAAFSGEDDGHLHNKTKMKQQSRSLNQSSGPTGGLRRQENLCWPFEFSPVDGTHHWQEQISQLQRQLDFSTSMCQTLLQDQQVCVLNMQITTKCFHFLVRRITLTEFCPIIIFFFFHRLCHTCCRLCWLAITACYPTTCRHHKSSWSCTSSTSAIPSWLGSRTTCKGKSSSLNECVLGSCLK